MDDWYVLAFRENVYALVYYCGCNDACCGYEGAVLYSRTPRFEDLSAKDVEAVAVAVAAAQVPGLQFDALCAPQAAPAAPAEFLI